MAQGVIIKSLSGFYTVSVGDSIVECKARGRFRHDGFSPLVGDRVEVTVDAQGKGRIDAVLERRNYFIRPAVANVDQIVMFAATVNPVTDPFLIDRVVAIAETTIMLLPASGSWRMTTPSFTFGSTVYTTVKWNLSYSLLLTTSS